MGRNLKLYTCKVKFQGRDIPKIKGLKWRHKWCQPYILGMFPHSRVLRIIKHDAKVILNLNVYKLWGVRKEGYKFLESGRDLTPYVGVLKPFNLRFFPLSKVSIISLLFCLLRKSMWFYNHIYKVTMVTN